MKTKKILAAAALLAMTTLAASAQPKTGTFSIIPRLGVSIANLSNEAIAVATENGVTEDFNGKYKAGLIAGAEVQYQALSRLAVSVGAFYAQRGCRFSDNEVLVSEKDNSYVGINDWNSKLNYIDVPIMGSFYFAPNLALNVGIQPSFKVGDANNSYTSTAFVKKEDGSKEYEESEKYNIKMAVHSFDLAIPVGLSYEYMNVIIDARYNIGLLNASAFDLGQTTRNRSFSFTVGYRFAL